MTDTATAISAADLMTEFAERTGLTGNRAPHRYLWTDAFAVCNYLDLYRRTGDKIWRDLARRRRRRGDEKTGGRCLLFS